MSVTVLSTLAARLIFGLVLSGLIGGFAYRRGALTISGVVGAVLTGTLTFGFGGLTWGAALVVFFVSSSALGHLGEQRKAAIKTTYEKGDQRDLGQALANGGVAALIAVLYGISGAPGWWGAYLGALAAANADTWATELGTLARAVPRLITTLQPVARGTSGGVTFAGCAASLGGGLLIGLVGLVSVLFGGMPSSQSLISVTLVMLVIGAFSGLLGSASDSLLGATVQMMYRCADRITEKPLCTDGSAATPLPGRIHWMGNDAVNFLASIVGALIGGLLYAVLVR